MSQIKRLEEDLEYLNRFSRDLESIKSSLEAREIMKSYDQACEELFTEIRAHCQNEIAEALEIDQSIAQNLQDFSNKILKIISDAKQAQWNNLQKAKCQVGLMEELLISTDTSKESLQNQIDEEKALIKEEVLNVPPPIREKVDIQKIDKF